MTGTSGTDLEAIFETDLHGYMDGELPAQRRVEVESYLAKHPNQAARFAEFNALTLSLHRLYGNGEPANPRIETLTDDLDRALRRRARTRRALRLALGALALTVGAAVASGLSGRFGESEDRFLAFTRQADDDGKSTVQRPIQAMDASNGAAPPPASGGAGAAHDDAAAQPATMPAPQAVPAGAAAGRTPEKT